MQFAAAWAFFTLASYREERVKHTEQYREHIEYTFAAFCKVILRNEKLNTLIPTNIGFCWLAFVVADTGKRFSNVEGKRFKEKESSFCCRIFLCE